MPLTDTEVIVARRRELEQFAIEDADVAQQLWHLTSGQLERADGHPLSPGRRTALERVATFLIEMKERIGGADVSPLADAPQ